jgi:hypothetical protein
MKSREQTRNLSQDTGPGSRATLVYLDTTGDSFVDKPAGWWDRMSPVALARLIERVDAGIPFHIGEHYEFVRALARMKRGLSRVAWNRILRNLEPAAWISCGSGPQWCPRVLGNGGVAIRNFHRVLGVDLRNGASVSGAPPSRIRREVETVLSRAAKTSEPGVMLMHHSSEGVIYTQRIPDNCVFRGQSFLFVPASLVRGLRVLGAAGGSGSGGLIFRLFHDTVCVYGSYRHGDDADTVIENFALARFDPEWKFPLTKLLDTGKAWPQFVEWIVDDLDEEFLNYGVPISLQKDFRTKMTAVTPNSWASRLYAILNGFPPLFSRDSLYPPVTERYNIYSLPGEPAGKRVTRTLSAFGVKRAKLAGGASSERIRSVTVPFHDLIQARNLAVALSKRFGAVRLTIPHLGLDHLQGGANRGETGNGDWFGFGRRSGVISVALPARRTSLTA